MIGNYNLDFKAVYFSKLRGLYKAFSKSLGFTKWQSNKTLLSVYFRAICEQQTQQIPRILGKTARSICTAGSILE